MKTTDILDALNAVDEETLAATEEFFAEKEGAKKVKVRKTVRILLVAAALALLLGATAYAAGLFGMSGNQSQQKNTGQYQGNDLFHTLILLGRQDIHFISFIFSTF